MSAPAVTNPLISVIIPTYNWSSVLRLAIQTVRWQKFTDWELLVVGDGCTDDSAEVVAAFGDTRISWHNLPANSGSQSAPNNHGLKHARGKYIAYLGHDDVWLPNHLEVLLRTITAAEADIAYTLCAMIGPPGLPSGLTGVSPSGQYEYNLFVPPSSLLHKADMIAEVGEWRDYRSIPNPPDIELLTRALEFGKRFAPAAEVTVFKFPSNMRRNSYRDKPCHEQAECIRRIQKEPDFLYREVLKLYMAQPARFRDVAIWGQKPAPGSKSFGEVVSEWRVFRGLESDKGKS